jgi:hypothetical protein
MRNSPDSMSDSNPSERRAIGDLMIISPLGNPNLGLILCPVLTDSPLPTQLTPEVSIVRLPEDMLRITREELLRLKCMNHPQGGEKTPFEAVMRPSPIG